MIINIIQKEIHDNLLNMRFVIACVISTVLIVATILTLAGSYSTDLRDYNDRQTTQEDFINHYGHINRFGWMTSPLQPPAKYAFLVLGLDREAQQENFLSNPMPVLFSQLDLVVIVSIIMSLIAILFSYNSISDERENGMLKQMLSTNISRRVILLGKFLGGTISILVPFTTGLLSGLLLITFNPQIKLQSVDFGIFMILILLSYIYISAFYALGLYFSSRSHSSNVAVLKSLFAWVIFVLMLPNISPFLATRIFRIPSKTQVEMQKWQIMDAERDTIVSRRTQELMRRKYTDIADKIGYVSSAGKDTAVLKAFANDHVFQDRYSHYQKDWLSMVNQINEGQEAKAKMFWDDFEQQSRKQEWIATIFACVSPLPNYVLAATNLTNSGIGTDDDWKTQVEHYNESMTPILTSIYNKALEKNPQLTVNDFIDLHEFPRFQYHPQDLTEKAAMAFPNFGMLLFFNLLFLVGAWVSFMRYDVR
jgi:ABC-type transport system involved in multi-copper enzyme maturation permease subunit